MNHETCHEDTTTNTTSPASTIESGSATAILLLAFNRCRASMAALDEKDVLVPNIDIQSASGTAINAHARIEALRESFAKHLPLFDFTVLDRLPDYARAARYAHVIYLGAAQPPKDLAVMQERAVVLRDTLYSDLSALAVRGLFDASRLKKFKQKVGYLAIAADIAGLSAMVRAGWPQFAGRTGTTERDLDEAENLSDQIVNAVAARENSVATIAQAAVDRQRAFTLLVKAYDQVRRAVIYLRWNEGDAEQIAPSLYAGRGNGGRKKSDDEATGSASEPGVVSATPSSEAHPVVAPVAETAPTVRVGSGLSASTAPGMPGSDPFGR